MTKARHVQTAPLRYFVYCRKSTDEKTKQILSIEQQIEELKLFGSRENLEIVDTFTEKRTAKEPGRKTFNNLLKLVEKGYANGIIAWHPDRLARNSVDGGKIIYLLDTGQLQDLKFPTFWFQNTSQGKFMLNIAFGQSKYYVDTLSENITRGMHYKARHGVWPTIAPLGYKNDRNTKTVVPHEKEFPLVREAFQKFASGDFTSIRHIQTFFFEHGLMRRNKKPLAYNQISRMLSRPFYYGLIVYGGETSEGKHLSAITKDVFDKVQERLHIDHSEPKYQKHEFAFTGFITCKQCGCAITAEKHTKHYPTTARTVDYIYYRCTKKHGICSQPYLRESVVDKQIRELVNTVSLNEAWQTGFNKLFAEDERSARLSTSAESAKLSISLEAVDKKLDKLLESFLDEVIDQEMYSLKKKQLLQGKLHLRSQMKKIKVDGCNWLEPMREFIKESADADKISRAKGNSDDLAIIAKKVGSNYLLDASRVLFFPKKPATSLAARAFAAREQPTFSQLC